MKEEGMNLKRKWLPVFLVALLLVSGFIIYNYVVTNAKPPMPSVEAGGNIQIPVKQGSYCWNGLINGECVDMVEPFMMNDKKIITVKPEEEIKITYSKKPLQQSKSVTIWTENHKEARELKMANGIFLAPLKKGVYGVSTDGNWKQGSASHVFFIRVK